MPTISVIVPVYNVEKYLSRCIDSILSQSYTDFELLLIDDGSPDNSGYVCDEYAKKDSRIRVFHKENEGVSSARNYGILHSLGEWITFIDSDDYIGENFFSSLFNINNADFSILTNVNYVYIDKIIIKSPNYNKNYYKNCEILDLLFETNFFTIGDGGACSKLFSKSILVENQILFQENNAAFEDTIFTLEYISYCNSVSVVDGSHYFYINRDEISLSKIIHPYNNYLESGEKALAILNKIQNKYNLDKSSMVLKLGISKYISVYNYSIFSLYKNYSQLNKCNRIKLLDQIKITNRAYKNLNQQNDIRNIIIKLSLNFFNSCFLDIIFISIFFFSSQFKKYEKTN